MAAVLASMASVVVDKPIVDRRIHDRTVSRRLTTVTVLVLVAGIGIMLLAGWEHEATARISSWLPNAARH